MNNGEKNLQNEGDVQFSLSENNSVLTGVLKDKNGNLIGTRIIAYDAIDDEYDMAWVGTNTLRGINPSTIKVKKSTPDEVVMVEKFKEDGRTVKIKHIVKRSSGEIEWDVHDLSDGDDENLVAHMTFTKSE